MNRRRILAAVLVLITTVAFTGCKKKPPVIPEPMEPPAPMQQTQEVPAPPPTPQVVDQGPDWESGELGELNRIAREMGLLGDVYFDYDKSDLKPEATARLAANAAFMRDQPRLIFTVEGHCDERGTNAYNLALGDRRANAASGYLATLGVSGARLNSVSYGEERPQCTASAESCWSQNRRAHFVITGRN